MNRRDIAAFALWALITAEKMGFEKAPEYGVDENGCVYAKCGYATIRASRDFSRGTYESKYCPAREFDLAGVLS